MHLAEGGHPEGAPARRLGRSGGVRLGLDL
jgi:hypothetical protein